MLVFFNFSYFGRYIHALFVNIRYQLLSWLAIFLVYWKIHFELPYFFFIHDHIISFIANQLSICQWQVWIFSDIYKQLQIKASWYLAFSFISHSFCTTMLYGTLWQHLSSWYLVPNLFITCYVCWLLSYYCWFSLVACSLAVVYFGWW